MDLGEITDLTLARYNERAEAFWTGTKDHDVGQNIAALLQHIKAVPPFNILDFGCGPGRDLKVFAELGHLATGLEGAMNFVEMARSHSGCEVWHQDFSGSICRMDTLTAYLPMLRCFMFPRPSYRVY